MCTEESNVEYLFGESLPEVAALKEWILSLIISRTTASLAGSQTAWLTCVSISCSPDDAVTLSGLKIHVLTKAAGVLTMKSNLASSQRPNGKFITKTKSCWYLLLSSIIHQVVCFFPPQNPDDDYLGKNLWLLKKKKNLNCNKS